MFVRINKVLYIYLSINYVSFVNVYRGLSRKKGSVGNVSVILFGNVSKTTKLMKLKF